MADSERSAGLDAPAIGRETVLLLAPPTDDGAAAYCRDHLVPAAAAESAPIVLVSANGTADRFADWDFAGRPGVVVVVGDSTRSASVRECTPSTPASPPETVLATGDLGSIGRTIDDYVTSWAASGRPPVVCVDSLSGLFGFGSVGGVYRFIYVLLHRVDEAGGGVHVHAVPRLYEEEILRTFFSLFDRVVSFQEGGALV